MYRFASATDVIYMNKWHLFSERRPQFASPNGFYSVYDQMYSQCAVCRSHWFLFCLSPYLFSEWHIVPQLGVQTKQSRVHSRKALSECKASRRLGKQIRCFYRFLSTSTYWLSRFLSKAHPYSRLIQQPKLRIPSSPYRSNNLSFPSAEVQIFPFYIPFPTLYLLQ